MNNFLTALLGFGQWIGILTLVWWKLQCFSPNRHCCHRWAWSLKYGLKNLRTVQSPYKKEKIMNNEYKVFSEFYSFYLSQHCNLICRRFHFVGSSMVLLIFFYIFYTGSWLLMLLLPLIGDWVMFKDMLIGNIRF